MKAIFYLECDVIQYDTNANFFAELGKKVDESEYKVVDERYAIELTIKLYGQEIKLKPYSYIVIKHRNIIGVFEREQKNLFKFIKEDMEENDEQ